jgi:hypothetical protein
MIPNRHTPVWENLGSVEAYCQPLSASALSADDLQKIEAAIPPNAVVTPKRTRKVPVFWRADAIKHKAGVPAASLECSQSQAPKAMSTRLGRWPKGAK